MYKKKSDTDSAQPNELELDVDQPDNVQEEMENPDDSICGIGSFAPASLQPLAHMYVFLPTIAISVIATFACSTYVVSQVTTMEKQFGITSSESGMMIGSNEVGYIMSIMLWSHIARKMHRPRVLALATFVFAIGAMLSVVPHFIMVSEAPDLYQTTGGGGDIDDKWLCLARNSTEVKSQISANSEHVRSIGYGIMFIAFGLQGITRAPRTPLTQMYLDDNVPKSQTGVYMGVLGGLAILGPVLSSVVARFFSQIYVTLDETSLTTRDPRWIGAWWLGFVVFACIAVVISFPTALFPKRMPNAPVNEAPHPEMPHKEHTLERAASENKDQETRNGLAIEHSGSVEPNQTRMDRLLSAVLGFFASLLRILRNPLYVLIVICDSIMFLTVIGRVAFLPKYWEQYFRVPNEDSGLYLGLCIALPGGLCVMIGGMITRPLKLTIRGMMIIRWVTDGLGAVILFLSLMVVCDQPIIYGLSNPSEPLKLVSPEVTNMTWDTHCMCLELDFLPSCGTDNRSYYSPCHAGCSTVLPNGDFGDCAGISASAFFNKTVTPGYCEEQCDSLVYNLILGVAGVIMSGMNAIQTNLTRLRSVQDRDRSLCLGLNSFVMSVLGFFAGPIIFGIVVDTACILWSEADDKGSCSLYDGDDLRIKMHVFTGGVMAAVIIMNGIIVLLTYKMKRYCDIAEWQRLAYLKEDEVAEAETREKKYKM